MNILRLTYRPDDDFSGELFATVESRGFSGNASAWFDLDRLREFCAQANVYPIGAGDEPTLEGGFWQDNGQSLRQRHLHVSLSPHDRQGAIRVTAKLATPSSNGEADDLVQRVEACFLVSYGDVGRFCASFSATLDGHIEEATLVAMPS